MIKKTVSKILILLLCLIGTNLHAAFFGKRAEGWHWYQDPMPIQTEEQDKTQNRGEKLSANEVVETYKKELENRLHFAWVNPNFKNIKAYQELQKEMLDKAQNFSEMWMRVVYNIPELDHTLVAPVNHKARHLYFDQKQQEATQTIQNLANTHGLFFFFDSQCRFCQEFAPIVQLFSKRYHWEVMPISADGGPLKEFSRPLTDNGIIHQWKIDRFPALFAVNPEAQEVIPIAYGMTSLDEIETRILLLAKSKENNQ